MRSILSMCRLVCCSGLLLSMSACGNGGSSGNTGSSLVVFVGASITEAWDFDAYFAGYSFRKVIHFDPDKTKVWGEIADQEPKIVVVKECAAYFYAEGGTPLADYESIMTRMVALIRGIGAVPVLATTIPVDVGSGDCTQLQLDDTRAFNDWIRGYCVAEGIVCLDLAGAIADAEGQLPTAFHDGDGLHPNKAGYDVLSPIIIPALGKAGL